MARRVALGELPGGGKGLRVSRPGFDVMNANLQPKQVSFDSRWPNAMKVHMTGTRTAAGTVLFGKTFARPPMVFIASTRNGRYHPMQTYAEYEPGTLPLRVQRDRVIFAMDSSWYPLTYVVVTT